MFKNNYVITLKIHVICSSFIFVKPHQYLDSHYKIVYKFVYFIVKKTYY